jgi:hypothetical protein
MIWFIVEKVLGIEQRQIRRKAETQSYGSKSSDPDDMTAGQLMS